MTVSELLSKLSSRELSEWMAYYKIEPWGETRADLRAGMMTAPLVNMWSKGTQAKPSDWIVDFEPQESQSWQHMKQVLQGVVESYKKGKRNGNNR